MLIDSHCHLQFPQFADDRQRVIERAREAGVSSMVVVGTDLEASFQALTLAETHRDLYATVGCHPHEASHLDHKSRRNLRALADSPRVVAIGEIGLDFYRNLSPPDAQRTAFRRLLDMAAELRLPVVIHARAADDEAFATLSDWVPQVRPHWPQGRPVGVLHCFSGDLGLARRYVDLGFLISIPGTVTYPNADRVAAVAAGLPLECLLVETDAPYLTPQSVRGRRNEPSFLVETVDKIAELRGQSTQDVADKTAQNAVALFALPQAAPTSLRKEQSTL
jgi:TatD DNase family protein